MKQLFSIIGKEDRLVIVDKMKRHEGNSKYPLAFCLEALYKFWYRDYVLESSILRGRGKSLCPGVLRLLEFVE